MDKRFFFIIALSLLLTNCADYLAERERLKLQNQKLALEKQRRDDRDTCEYYGFKINTTEFSDCLMKLDIARKQEIITRKMLECEAVRKSNSESGVSGFWGGVLMGARENLACD